LDEALDLAMMDMVVEQISKRDCPQQTFWSEALRIRASWCAWEQICDRRGNHRRRTL